ncbi:disease resistance protein RPM1-like [Carex rostrata]
MDIAVIALKLIVEKAASAITNEIGSLLGVEQELVFIMDELEIIHACLQDASTMIVKDKVTTIWIKQVQRLASELEDFIKKANVHLGKKGWLSVMGSVTKRDQIAKKIRELKTTIEVVSARKQRYKLSYKEYGGHTYNESASTGSIANAEERKLQYNPSNKEYDGHTYDESASTGSIANSKERKLWYNPSYKEYGDHTYDESDSTVSIADVEHYIVGLDEPKRELVELILKERGEIISVVGMGGIGKTTLVREVYGCQELRDEFKYFAWVTVQHPFKEDEFMESLARQIVYDVQEVLPKKTVKEKVIEYLKHKKYLIVLDDMFSVSEWVKIKRVLPNGNGSRIIVTTRLRILAEYISHPSDKIYEMKEHSEKEAFDLFWKSVYKTPNYCLVVNGRYTKYGQSSTEIMEDDNEEKQCRTIAITADMKVQAGLIINSCGRLPLAIAIVGSYLATKPKTSAEWKAMHDHLSSELANNRDLGEVNTALISSYAHMPHHLKPSLMYLSVFHNHKEIRRSRIIRRWMADGYVKEGRTKTAEKAGKGYFYDLIRRNCIQPSQTSIIANRNVKRCNIHDLMYDLILAKAKDENMVSLLVDENLITMTDKGSHLVIAGGPCNGDKVLERVNLSHVQSVSIFGEMGDYLRYPTMEMVRVLDLEGTFNLQNQDLKSVGKLRHLKYLGLRGTKITTLPNSLGKLSELETLDIRNTSIDRLPKELAKLHKLSYLRAGSDHFGSFGVTAPYGIGKLLSLNIFGMIDIGERNALAKEMQNLTNLRKLAVTGFTKNNGKTLAMVIDGLKHLKSLVLSAADDLGLKSCLESVSVPPKYLQSLKLYSILGRLPNWFSSLENLEKIHFRNTLLMEEIKAIGRLPNLKILYMSYNSFKDLKELYFGEDTFPGLQRMILEGIKELESVLIEKKALKKLEQLKISKCWSIGRIDQHGVWGLKFLIQLKEMEVVVSQSESDKTFVSNLQKNLSMLPQKPVLRVFKSEAPN